MNAFIKKVHVYVALLSFTALAVYGVAGLQATIFPHREGEPPRSGDVRFEPYTPPPAFGDKEVADDVYRRLGLAMSGPLPAYAVKRDSANNLAFAFYSPNGPTRVTVLEKEQRLRIETVRVGLGQFLNNLHATTAGARAPALRLQLWKIYNEIGIWALVTMVITGAYLGLTSRPRFRWGKYALALGSAAFVTLYIVTR